MTLEAGTRLGHYEIGGAIGAGGMGEVYKARDTRLDRTVAIKVLPTHLSENEQLRERFAREACVISSASYPRNDVFQNFCSGRALAGGILYNPVAPSGPN